ncbi:MAG: replicative DNA helicase [Clostridia bacterium]|nr:replicative DNA helicase [Clostridia bacterium]
MNDDFLKKLPFSLIAEQSLLGAILSDPDCFNDITERVKATDFYLTEHSQIYTAMLELFKASKQIDIVTLIDMLVKRGVYTKSGGEDYIRTLGQVVPNSLNVLDYADIVKEKSLLRTLIDACNEISDTAYSEEGKASEIINFAESKIFELSQGRDTRNFKHISDVIGEVFISLNELASNSGSHGTNTGFSGLDNVLAGMGNSDLIIVGARPGMGKTSFALNIATNVATQTKKKVCIFSLEMSAEQLVSRIISSEAMVESKAMRTGKLSTEQWDNIAHAADKLAGCDILIDDTSNITVSGMIGKLRRVENLGLVVVDYLQLMQGENTKSDNRAQVVGDISRGLKLMAKELNVPIICCAQLSRDNEKRGTSSNSKRPVLSDLRDSGSIEQDADIVIFIHREEYYNQEAKGEGGSVAEIIVAKNRHGSTDSVKMGWIGSYTKFRTIVNVEEPS